VKLTHDEKRMLAGQRGEPGSPGRRKERSPGREPKFASDRRPQSPGGAAEQHFAAPICRPSGAEGVERLTFHGLAPVATFSRPAGAEDGASRTTAVNIFL